MLNKIPSIARYNKPIAYSFNGETEKYKRDNLPFIVDGAM
jgi:hypothetical protein